MVSMITLERFFTRDSTTLMLTKRTIVMQSDVQPRHLYFSITVPDKKKSSVYYKPEATSMDVPASLFPLKVPVDIRLKRETFETRVTKSVSSIQTFRQMVH